MRALGGAAKRFRVLGAVPSRGTVCDEDEIEFAAFGGLRKLAVVIDIEVASACASG